MPSRQYNVYNTLSLAENLLSHVSYFKETFAVQSSQQPHGVSPIMTSILLEELEVLKAKPL